MPGHLESSFLRHAQAQHPPQKEVHNFCTSASSADAFSFHVYDPKNRERVRKDEEKARIEEERKAEVSLQAVRASKAIHLGSWVTILQDRERRLELLRKRARASDETDLGEQKPEHINLFAEQVGQGTEMIDFNVAGESFLDKN